MSNRPEKLGRALNRALRALNMDARVKESRAMVLWPEVVGEVTAARTRPMHVNRGIMVVAVASSAWANQLNLLKSRYLEGLAALVGPEVIQDLRWRVAEIKPGDDPHQNPLHLAAVTLTPREPRPAPELDEAERAAIARQVAEIGDPKLAARMAEVLTAQAVRRLRLREVGWVPCQRCGVLHDTADRPYMRARTDTELAEAPSAPRGKDTMEVSRMCPPCRLEVGPGLDA